VKKTSGMPHGVFLGHWITSERRDPPRSGGLAATYLDARLGTVENLGDLPHGCVAPDSFPSRGVPGIDRRRPWHHGVRLLESKSQRPHCRITAVRFGLQRLRYDLANLGWHVGGDGIAGWVRTRGRSREYLVGKQAGKRGIATQQPVHGTPMA
jgi:hypothetical protein